MAFFPYVSKEEKETTFENNIQLNNGDIFHIASYFNGYQRVELSSGEYWWGYTKGVQNSSDIISLQAFIDDTSDKIINKNDVLFILNSVHTNSQRNDYYETTEYIELRDSITDNLVWIWGSIEAGGLFCFRTSQDGICIWMLDGFYQKEIYYDGLYDHNEFGYSLDYVINDASISANDFSKVLFMYDAISALNNAGNNYFPGSMLFFAKNETGICEYAKLLRDEIAGYFGYVKDNATIGNFDFIADIYTEWIETSILEGNLDDPESIFSLPVAPTSLNNGWNFDGLIKIDGNPWGDAEIDTEDNPYYDGGFGGSGGGGASLDNDTDTSTPSDCDIDNNTIDVCSTGLVLMYNPTVGEITAFNNFLYSGITDSIANTLKKLTSDPLQYIISLGLVHFTPPTSARSEISFGGIGTGVSANRINKQMKSFDFGYIDIRQEFKSFVDYNSRASIYLPYIGYRELDINEIRGSRVRLKYNVDLLTGSCVAYLHISRSSRGNGDCLIYNNMYFYEGNCLLQIPMFATDSKGTIQSLMSALGAGVSLATGNAVGAVSGAVDAITQQKVAVGRAGSIGSNYGYMSGQEAFIVIERPIMQVPYNFGAYEGWTANINEKIKNLTGYTEIDDNTIWSDNFGHATNEECQMIKDIMNGGVYL